MYLPQKELLEIDLASTILLSIDKFVEKFHSSDFKTSDDKIAGGRQNPHQEIAE